MRIENSSVQMYGASTSVEKNTKEEALKTWTGSTRPVFEDEKDTTPFISDQEAAARIKRTGNVIQKYIEIDGINLRLSSEGQQALKEQLAAAAQNGTPDVSSCVSEDDEGLLEISDKDKQKIYLLERMIRYLTGKSIKFVLPRGIKLDNANEAARRTGNPNQFIKPVPQQADVESTRQLQAIRPQRLGWGLEYDYHETHYEKQAMSFSAEGTVKTADGKEISFDLDLKMSREFASRLDISMRAGDAVRMDPLVVNFGTPSASLTDSKISFDIDSDGTEDQISFVNKGSGFLALDINNDGTVNNGSELFGPQSGNGFAELAKYDGDGNNWIDENDDIYDKLRIWTKDANGNDQLFALGAKGIGAIYLGNVDTSYALKNAENQELGNIARSGIFLRENGAAGTIQHVDLAL